MDIRKQYRIKEIEVEIAKLQAEKNRIEEEANRKYQDDDIEKFSKSYSGQRLLEKYSLNTEGIWKIEGEDPNCDFGGPHHNPLLGYLEGNLENVIKAAVKMKGWFTWGGGGYITKVETKLVTKV